jgi:hypothetical protein
MYHVSLRLSKRCPSFSFPTIIQNEILDSPIHAKVSALLTLLVFITLTICGEEADDEAPHGAVFCKIFLLYHFYAQMTSSAPHSQIHLMQQKKIHTHKTIGITSALYCLFWEYLWVILALLLYILALDIPLCFIGILQGIDESPSSQLFTAYVYRKSYTTTCFDYQAVIFRLLKYRN